MNQNKQIKNYAEQFQPKNQDFSQVEILKYALEMRHLTVKQIEKRFFDNNPAQVQINSMLEAGLLRKRDQVVKYGSILIPTQKAFDEVIKFGENNHLVPEPLANVFGPRINHDSILSDIRIKFEELEFISKWYSDRMMEKVAGLPEMFEDLPDACCRKTAGRAYFLELEISQKSRAKYVERIRMYEEILKNDAIKEQEIDGVMFLCTDPKVGDILKELTAGKGKHFSVFHIDRYLGGKPNAISQQYKTKSEPVAAQAM